MSVKNEEKAVNKAEKKGKDTSASMAGKAEATAEKEDSASPFQQDNEGTVAAGEASGENLKDELENMKQEAARNYDRLLRVSAEFDNYKKRMQREMEGMRKFANESLLKDLLTVVDNLERAIAASGSVRSEHDSCVVEGIELTLNDIMKLLKKYDVTPIESVGKPFDPAYHEAVMQEPSDQYPPNTVIKEFQKGYMIHDRLLRPAMVVVSTNGGRKQDDANKES